MLKSLDESGDVRAIIDHIAELHVTPELKCDGFEAHGYTKEGEHFSFVFPTHMMKYTIFPDYKQL